MLTKIISTIERFVRRGTEDYEHFPGIYQAEELPPNRKPNKAPEPTTTSVMPRAISRIAVLKQRNLEPNPARVMPDAVVAHL